MADDDPFEVAIIDHKMPEMDGEELRRRIRDDRRFDGLKLALSSSTGVAVTHAGAGQLGFNAALPKPLRRSAMLGCLARLYDLNVPWDRAEPVKEKTSVEGHHGARLRILVVEDNKVNQLVACAILDTAGHRADVAGNGIEALQALNSRPYDLVLMDMQMPEMDGIEATSEIRKLPSEVAQIPIIAMTANAMKGDREKCIQAGMNDYVAKPVDAAQLLDRIAYWAGGDEDVALGGGATAALEDRLDTRGDDAAADPGGRKREPA